MAMEKGPCLSVPDNATTPSDRPKKIKRPKLSEPQQQSAQIIQDLIKQKDYFTVLLYGATGSGKTATYLDCAHYALSANENNGQVLILVPEIGLIRQLKEQIQCTLHIDPVVWSSNSSIANKRSSLSAIINGTAQIIIGTRSALMLPYQNLKLIVVDEEHDPSYKQENAPIYHARDMSVLRAQTEKIVAILCSATPSIETLYNAKKGKYQLVLLAARYCSQSPKITIIDMQKTGQVLNSKQLIATETRQIMQHTIQQGKQVLLLLNKRGFATIALCKKCAHAIHCCSCSVKMTVHKTTEGMLLKCHQCNHQVILHCSGDINNQTIDLTSDYAVCTKCNSSKNIVPYGPRIEHLQEEVTKAFPAAINILISSDSKKKEEAFDKIRHNKVDIIIGTQILAKGHNFLNLGLVVIISGDVQSWGIDFRSNEKTYQLLHQAIGRSGRAKEQGRAIIQTHNTKSDFIQILASLDYDKFYEYEISYREKCLVPPFTCCTSITAESTDEKTAQKNITEIHQGLTPFEKELVTILAPQAAAISKRLNYYRYQMIIFTKNYDVMSKILECLNKMPLVNKEYCNDDVVKIDINPVNFM